MKEPSTLAQQLWDTIVNNEHAKRAIEIAIAGNHSILFIGSSDSVASALNRVVLDLGHGWGNWRPPCPCGYWRHPTIECTCDVLEVQRHRQQLRDARSYIYVEVTPIRAESLIAAVSGTTKRSESLQEMCNRVDQAASYKKLLLDPRAQSLLVRAMRELSLDYESAMGIIKVSRTIANISSNPTEVIQVAYIAEAIQYRFQA